MKDAGSNRLEQKQTKSYSAKEIKYKSLTNLGIYKFIVKKVLFWTTLRELKPVFHIKHFSRNDSVLPFCVLRCPSRVSTTASPASTCTASRVAQYVIGVGHRSNVA